MSLRFWGDPVKPCTCSSATVTKYQKRVSGPLLDRIDIHVEVPVVEYSELVSSQEAEPSADIRERVNMARRVQDGRFRGSRTYFNAHMGPRHLRRYCRLDEASQGLIKSAVERFSLSARAYDRILKVARTIADLDGSEEIGPKHISESIQYRTLDRGMV